MDVPHHIPIYSSAIRLAWSNSWKGSWSFTYIVICPAKIKFILICKKGVFDRHPGVSATTFLYHCLYSFKFLSLTTHSYSVPLWRFMPHSLFHQEILILEKIILLDSCFHMEQRLHMALFTPFPLFGEEINC